MVALGKLLALTGFVDVLGFAATGISRNIRLGIGFHALLLLILLGYWVYQAGSLSAWYQSCSSSKGARGKPIPAAFIALFFAAAGIGIFFWGQPGQPKPGSRPMTESEIRYFGTIFFLIGSGGFLMVIGSRREMSIGSTRELEEE